MLNVLDLSQNSDIEIYNRIYKIINTNDPYFLYDYLRYFTECNSNLISFVYLDDISEKYILMPGYISNVSISNTQTEYKQFSSPYGYTGPLTSKEIDEKTINQFWIDINEWYSKNNVVTEFVRFNLFENFNYYNSTLHKTMLNVKGCIINEELQWKLFDSKVRKNVNKAKREGLISKIIYLDITDIEIECFYDIYIKTMIRTKASKKFYYNLSDFKSFIRNNPYNSAICNVYFEEKVISSELILVSKNSIFSFLGGTDEIFFDKRPNDFLKFELINWARRNGKDYYVLGGGYGYEDGIFKYKKSFFPNDIVTFFTGRKIVNDDIYIKLVKLNNTFRINNSLDPLSIEDESFFPLFNKID